MKLKISRKTGVIMVVIAVVVAVVAIVVNVLNSQLEDIDASYFVSDETKLVRALTRFESSYDTSEYAPETTYVVYEYEGEEISRVRIFFEYYDADEAATMNAGLSMDDKAWASGRKLNGKYVIFDVKDVEYRDLTATQVRDIIGE